MVSMERHTPRWNFFFFFSLTLRAEQLIRQPGWAIPDERNDVLPIDSTTINIDEGCSRSRVDVSVEVHAGDLIVTNSIEREGFNCLFSRVMVLDAATSPLWRTCFQTRGEKGGNIRVCVCVYVRK